MSELRAWLQERLPLARFGTLAVFLVLLGGPPKLERLPLVGLALLLLAVFRLRDDLADRQRDALVRPERVLVRARSIRPFVLAMATALALASALTSLARGLGAGLGALGLAAVFELGYRRGIPARHRWVLLKYPAFVLLLADAIAPTLLGLCYLAFVVHERLDDAALRSRPDADLRVAAYLLAAALLTGAHLLGAAASLGWLLASAGLWALASEAARGQETRFGLFLLCLLLWAHDQQLLARGWS